MPVHDIWDANVGTIGPEARTLQLFKPLPTRYIDKYCEKWTKEALTPSRDRKQGQYVRRGGEGSPALRPRISDTNKYA